MMPPMNNPLTNNPVMTLMQIARNGGNPLRAIQELAMRDPRAAQANRIIQGKSPAQLRQIAENMARERGMDLNQILGQFR